MSRICNGKEEGEGGRRKGREEGREGEGGVRGREGCVSVCANVYGCVCSSHPMIRQIPSTCYLHSKTAHPCLCFLIASHFLI